MSFEADVTAWARKAGASTDEAIRMITLELFSAVVMSTPVDTGRLRGNWQVSIGTPVNGITEREDKSGGSVLSEISGTIKGIGAVNYLTNNLPYAARIEYAGWSGQAPQGMVRVNFSRIQSIVSAAATEVSS